jgi:DNA (cytosine-5)-methyltransferase 1
MNFEVKSDCKLDIAAKKLFEATSNDERNQLVSRFIDYVEYFEPDVAVMENVVGILSMNLPGYDNGDVVNYIHERYKAAGYTIKHKTLHANNFGIPQTRSRVFFIAVKEGIGTLNSPKRKLLIPPKKSDLF